MRYWMITILAGILYANTNAQSDISGRVTDEAGQALVGANVYIDKTFRGAITGVKGDYVIGGLPVGHYIVKASYIGYETGSEEIELNGDQVLNFDLNETSVMAEEVLVVATRAGQNSPVAHTNVSKEEITERNMGQDIPYLLSLTPSMVVSSDAGTGIGYTSFRIRGTDMNRTNVTVNGIPLNDSESHGVWWINMPDFASSVDNVQIQRGVGTSTNGGAAFGATMNFQTFTMNPEPYGEFNSTYGSFNTWKNSLSVGTGMLANKFTLDARISEISSDGYIDRAFSDLQSYFVSGAWYGEKSLLKVNVFSGKEQTYQAWYGVPSELLQTNRTFNPAGIIISSTGDTSYYDNETDNYQQDHYQLFYSRELGKRFTFNGALHYTYGRGYFEGYRQDESLADYQISDVIGGGDTIGESDIIRQKWLDNDFYGFTWSLNYKYKKLEAHMGGGWNRYDGRHFGKVVWARFPGNSEINHEWYRNTGRKRDWNTYLKLNYRIGRQLSLFGDLQYRSIEHYIKGIDDDLRDVTQLRVYQFFNPKLGATYDISDKQRIATSIAVGNREPNRTNLVDADTTKPVPTYETLMDYELAYRLNLTYMVIDVNLFYMDYHNQLVLTGQINDVGAAIMNNVKDSYRTGIEIVVGIIPAEKFKWDLNLTLSRNKIRSFADYVDDWDNYPQQVSTDLGETDLSFSPGVVGGSKLMYEPVEGLSVALLTKYVSKQYIDNTSSDQRKLDPYLVNDLQLQYRLHPRFMEEIGFKLMLNNILNEKYETNAWIYRYNYGGAEYSMDGYFPQAGFNFMVGMTLKF
ncbi:TonB-dependent receptor [Bacteroidota bacterium]